MAPDAKDEARTIATEAVKTGGFGHRMLVIRCPPSAPLCCCSDLACDCSVNGLDTPWGQQDLNSVSACPADAVLVPKVESAEVLAQVRRRVGPRMQVWAMIETPLGVLRVSEIAGGGNVDCLVMGTSDLTKDLQAQHTTDRAPMVTSLGLCLLAARAFGIRAIDGVHLDLSDDEGLRASCEQGLAFGFDGKTLIHPRTVSVANEVFAPSEERVKFSKRVITSHAEATARGEGVVVVDGQLIENLHVEEAERIVALHESIASRS